MTKRISFESCNYHQLHIAGKDIGLDEMPKFRRLMFGEVEWDGAKARAVVAKLYKAGFRSLDVTKKNWTEASKLEPTVQKKANLVTTKTLYLIAKNGKYLRYTSNDQAGWTLDPLKAETWDTLKSAESTLAHLEGYTGKEQVIPATFTTTLKLGESK